MTVDEVIGSLQAREERLNKRNEESSEQVLATKATTEEKEGARGGVQYRGRGRGNYRGRGRGRALGAYQSRDGGNFTTNNYETSTRGRGRGRGCGRGSWRSNEGRDKSNVQCHNCSKYGHYASECWSPPKEVEETANNVQEEEVKGTLMLSHQGDEKPKDNMWYMDNAASNHMCGKRNMFVDMDESVKGNVVFGDSSKVPIKGRGTILIRLKNGSQQSISDVYYVPDMTSNILSLGQLMEKNYEVHMVNRQLELLNEKKQLLARVPMSRNRMFTLNIQTEIAKCLKVCVKDNTWLWHLRYGHLNFGGLKLLGQKKMVHGLPVINHPDQLCEGCLVGKQFRASFPKESLSRAKAPLELVHADLCGPITPTSFGKNKYFLLFIDDYSRKTWVYFLKQKSDTFEAFKKFKMMVENESGRYIKAMRSDRGGEFMLKKFRRFCEYQGIRRFLTVP
ncbi:unnamed protein product [Linum trigynum]